MNWSETAKRNQSLLLPRRLEVLGLVDTEDRDVCMSLDEYFDAWLERGSAPFQQAMLLLIDGTVAYFLYAWTSGKDKLLKTSTGAVLFCA